MITGLKPYPAMKESGVPWLGAVPEHWQVRRGKWLFRSKKELNSNLRNSNILSLTLRGVVNNNPDDPEGLVPKDYATYQLFEKDDLVFKLIDLENIRTSRVGLVHEDGIMSPAYVRLVQAHDGIQRYFFQQYFDLYQRGVFNQLGAGVRSTLAARDLLEVFVLNPTVQEQAAIVRFLDHADRRIRRYIRAKQKLIKLLEEQKQAIIHRAVTRGLDPNVRLKPSGVEWLGDVPEHWEIRRVKSLSLVKRGASPRPIADPKYFDESGEYAWVRIADVSASDRYLEKTTQRLSVLGQSLSVRLQPGALFLSIAGSVGKPIITRIKCCIHDGFVYFPSFRGNAEFLFRVFSCGAPFGRLGKLGTQLNLNTDTVGGIFIGWPPPHEQFAIVAYLDEATASSERTIASAKHEIALLREYRTRLIADVVTGKLDVREAAARLPAEAVEPEPLDEIEAEGEADEARADETDQVPAEAEA